MQVHANRVLLSACALAAWPLAACQQLPSSKHLDTGAFAENTVSMAGEIQRCNRAPVWVYLVAHRDRPSILAVRTTAEEVRRLPQSIALYSIQVVALHESRLEEGPRVAALARYIDEVTRPGILAGRSADIGISAAQFESSLARIRSCDTLCDALAAAQPLVTAVMGYGNVLFDQADLGVAAVAEDLQQQIELEFQPLLENIQNLEQLHVRLGASFGFSYRIRLEESATWSELLAADPDLAHLLPAGKELTPAVLDSMEQRLTSQLEHIGAVRGQLGARCPRLQRAPARAGEHAHADRGDAAPGTTDPFRLVALPQQPRGRNPRTPGDRPRESVPEGHPDRGRGALTLAARLRWPPCGDLARFSAPA